MSQLKAQGTSTDYMINIFVTKTFPNHHTMATGFYAETHGVVDNEFFDSSKNNTTKYSYELYHYNNNILPIWVCSRMIIIFWIYISYVLYFINALFQTVNEKNGRRSGTMMWPGSVFAYQGTSPTFAQVCTALIYRITY